MKLVNPPRDSRVQALEDENAVLRQRNSELERELDALKRQTSKYKPPSRSSDSISLTANRHYLLPTEAFKRRASSIPVMMPQIRAAPPFERKDVIVESRGDSVDFSMPTLASRRKMKPPVRVPPDDGSPTDCDPLTDGWEVSHTEDTEDLAPCACPVCAAITAASDDSSSASADNTFSSLWHRTRKGDHHFYSTLAGKLPLSFKRQAYYLSKAYSVAQDTLWAALFRNYPSVLKHHYLEGPATILFGVGDLEKVFGTLNAPSQNAGLCTKPPSDVMYAIHNVVRLRNALAHQRPRESKEIDGLMEEAQGLAITLLDRIRAEKVRRLRDQMQREVQREYDSVLEYETLLQLPFGAKRVPLHHQVVFSEICQEYDRHDCATWHMVEKYGEGVIRAARAWQARYLAVGDDDPRRCAVLARPRARGPAKNESAGRDEAPRTFLVDTQEPTQPGVEGQEPPLSGCSTLYKPSSDGR